jgi:hypothetical protein
MSGGKRAVGDHEDPEIRRFQQRSRNFNRRSGDQEYLGFKTISPELLISCSILLISGTYCSS